MSGCLRFQMTRLLHLVGLNLILAQVAVSSKEDRMHLSCTRVSVVIIMSSTKAQFGMQRSSGFIFRPFASALAALLRRVF